MTVRSRSLTIAAAVVLAAPADAAPWSAPRDIAAPPAQASDRPFAPGIAFNGGGRGAVGWITDAGEEGDRAAAAWAPRGAGVFSPGVKARQAERVGASTFGNFALYGRRTIAFAGITGSERPAVAVTRLDALAGGRRIILFPHRRAVPRPQARRAWLRRPAPARRVRPHVGRDRRGDEPGRRRARLPRSPAIAARSSRGRPAPASARSRRGSADASAP